MSLTFARWAYMSSDETLMEAKRWVWEYYSAINKNKILPFAAMWMDLGGIMLSEISQRKTNTV